MPPAATFHAQLASIMEVLANTAVAEICELVDSGYAVLQLEISRGRKENEVLRRKLRLMELRAARTAVLRAASSGSGAASAALLPAGGRPRVHLLGGCGAGARALETPADVDAALKGSSQDPGPAPDPGQEVTLQAVSTGETSAVIKVEDDEDGDGDESWSQSGPERGFCRVAEGQATEAEAPPTLVKQEVAGDEDDDGGGVPWTSGEAQHALSGGQGSDAGAYDSLVFELQHVSQNPAVPETAGSSAPTPGRNASDDPAGGGGFGFSRGDGGQPAAGRQRDAAGQSAFLRRDGWRLQNRVHRDASGAKAFVCNCCGKALACLKNLKTHMRVHTGEKPFICALCGKRFSDSSNLKRHQSVHTGEKRYGCVHCGKRFAQSGSLKVHMSVHRDCKQFRCSLCGKSFTSGGHLRRHVTSHAGEKRFAAASP